MLFTPSEGSVTLTSVHPGIASPPIEKVTWSAPPPASARAIIYWSPTSAVSVTGSSTVAGDGLNVSRVVVMSQVISLCSPEPLSSK